MAVTYRFLTVEQQKELAAQKSFQFEYEHFVARIEADADPTNPDKQAAVTLLEKQVVQAQSDYDALSTAVAAEKV